MSHSAATGVYQFKHFKYSSHYWILRFLGKPGRPLKVLDVGAADGYLGAILKERGHQVVGVEQDPGRAAAARVHYHQFHAADIEAFEFPYQGEFDFILFADVLEHLRDPAAVLRRALPCLKDDGEIIISVPNIANFVIRIGLLLGRFEYSERGILDKTHLRFFTLKSLHRMLTECRCRAIETRGTPIPVQLVAPASGCALFAPLHAFHSWIVCLWKALFAYQFVVRVRRAHS